MGLDGWIPNLSKQARQRLLTTVMPVAGSIDALKVEHDENEQRKEPTVSERVALAEAIAERLQGRQLANLVQNRGGNISTSDETGKTHDIAAAKAGLGSGKTLEAAQKVAAMGWRCCSWRTLRNFRRPAGRARRKPSDRTPPQSEVTLTG